MKSSLIQCPDGGGALGGATVGLYQNGGYDEKLITIYNTEYAELKKLKNGWTNKRDKYEEAHRAELTLWNAASRYLHANLTKTKTLPISKWKQKYADLKEQRDTDYTKLKFADV